MLSLVSEMKENALYITKHCWECLVHLLLSLELMPCIFYMWVTEDVDHMKMFPIQL
jgi:hypothetical protein